MVRAGNFFILILALGFVTDGSSIALSPFVYNSQFRQMPDFNTFKNEELGKMLIKIRILFKSTKDTVPEVDFHHSVLCASLPIPYGENQVSLLFIFYRIAS